MTEFDVYQFVNTYFAMALEAPDTSAFTELFTPDGILEDLLTLKRSGLIAVCPILSQHQRRTSLVSTTCRWRSAPGNFVLPAA